MRWRQVFLVANTLATVLFWYVTYNRISRAHTTAITNTEFSLFSMVMIAWGLFFGLDFIGRLNRYEKAEVAGHGN